MRKPNYGIDAPQVIRNLIVIGIHLILLGLFLPAPGSSIITNLIKPSLINPGICLIISGLLMLIYSKFGKYKQRKRILERHLWVGNETVLDVGTGLGLLLIGAAKKLTTGKAYGIDIFSNKDLSSNNIQQLKRNIELEGVSGKTEIITANILEPPFQSEMFDLIISNLCIHNIPDKKSRILACKEIHRLLKTEGTVIISDFIHIREYQKTFEKLGMKTQKRRTYFWDTFPPLTIITAKK